MALRRVAKTGSYHYPSPTLYILSVVPDMESGYWTIEWSTTRGRGATFSPGLNAGVRQGLLGVSVYHTTTPDDNTFVLVKHGTALNMNCSPDFGKFNR